ncbi:caspase family protein [Nostoc sp. ChiQUE01b]|uniref:caspase family protein n=1 Tax=Nostoc sp. ChiQUE01b TaxID=3075376 RepID=UPI002AD31C2A|nr:caspase family protein [Nostoc sp. ChiQUE01b]MDZ8260409.1 caspase family protein [Nostoc sp. ChiQUE01b]
MSNATFSNGHALMIGVGFDLPVTVKDAIALRDVLVDPNRAAYPQHQVQLLTEDKANRQEVIEAFDHLSENVSKNPDATVIIYFSGHGGRTVGLNGISEYFLVTHDYAQRRQTNKAISGDEFTKKIEAINSRKLIVLLDCCHAAGMPALKDGEENFIKSPVPPSLLQALDSGRGRVVIASSRENEKSYTGNPYSVFTTCLLEALGGKAARTQDGFARILDVLTYLVEQVPLKTSDSSKYRLGQQHPFVNNISNLDENFALCYYAGGSKDVPNSIFTHTIGQGRVSLFKQKELERLKQDFEMLETERYQLSNKLGQLKSNLNYESDVASRIKIENIINRDQERVDDIDKQLSKMQEKIELIDIDFNSI